MKQVKGHRYHDLLKRNSRLISKNNKRSDAGSIALEYVLVSTFATVIGIALLGFAGHTFKQKVEQIMDKFAASHDELEFSIFGDAP